MDDVYERTKRHIQVSLQKKKPGGADYQEAMKQAHDQYMEQAHDQYMEQAHDQYMEQAMQQAPGANRRQTRSHTASQTHRHMLARDTHTHSCRPAIGQRCRHTPRLHPAHFGSRAQYQLVSVSGIEDLRPGVRRRRSFACSGGTDPKGICTPHHRFRRETRFPGPRRALARILTAGQHTGPRGMHWLSPRPSHVCEAVRLQSPPRKRARQQ